MLARENRQGASIRCHCFDTALGLSGIHLQNVLENGRPTGQIAAQTRVARGSGTYQAFEGSGWTDHESGACCRQTNYRRKFMKRSRASLSRSSTIPNSATQYKFCRHIAQGRRSVSIGRIATGRSVCVSGTCPSPRVRISLSRSTSATLALAPPHNQGRNRPSCNYDPPL